VALTTPSFTVGYDLDVESAGFSKFRLEDTTDYAAEGIADADVTGGWVIVSPDGTTRPYNADINGAVSFVNTAIPIPKDSNLDFLEGTYSFFYAVIIAGAVQPGTYYSGTLTFDFCPELKPRSTIAPLLGAAPSISLETSCFCFLITAADLTDYGTPTTTSRAFSLYPPPSLLLSPYTTSAATLTYNFQYSGTYQVQVNTLVTYVDGIFTITVRVKGSVFESVNCDINLCGITTCYNTYRSDTLTQLNATGGFTSISKTDLDKWMRIHAAFEAFDMNLKCGNGAEATAVYNELKTLLNCNCNCNEDDAPRLLNPYCLGTGSNNSITVVAPGTGIDVSTAVVGSTTTYTVSVEQAYLDAITTNTTDITNLTNTVNLILVGTSGNNYRLIENDTTVVGTDANLLEKTLIQETLTAGLLAADGDYLKIRAFFSLASNANVKTCKVYFGAFVLGFVPQPNGTPLNMLELCVEVTRTGAATQITSSRGELSGIPSSEFGTQPGTATEILAGAILVKMTGQNGTALANDIRSHRLVIEYHKKA